MYYLNSRYYDPEIGRFINIDDISYLDPETFNGLNLYVYCLNNPIMLTDSLGSSWFSDVWNDIKGFFFKVGDVVFGAVASFVLTGVGILISVGSFGSLATLGNTLIGAGIGGFIGGVQSKLNGGSFWGGYLGGAVTGGIAGALGGVNLFLAFVGGFGGNVVGSLITDSINGETIDWNYIGNLVAESLVTGSVSILGFRFGTVTELLKKPLTKNIYAGLLAWAEFASSILSDSIIKILNDFVGDIKRLFSN